MFSFEPITDRPVRIAIVGCGRISRNHFAALNALAPEVEIVGVCDTVATRFEAIPWKELPHVSSAIPRFGRLEQMLEANESGSLPIDAAVLATPSGLHASQGMKCARSGLHVITEKPMATRWQDALDLVRTCDDEQVRLFVVKQNRFNPTLRLVKRALDERRFGRIYLVCINVFWQRPQNYYDSDRWRGTWELDGGALMNQASHYVDLLDYFIGPVESVHAMTATLGRRIEVEDTATLNVRWRNGGLGSVAVTMLAYPKNIEGSLMILGEKGTVRVGGVAVNTIERWDFAEPRDWDGEIEQANYDTASVYGFGHLPYYRNVVETLRGRTEPQTDGREGLRSLEVLIAAYLSARDGRTVSLPLQY
jgi:UDP-N-acetyl-2-amino-2-deoxyglucuronate dehydrogenase